jgi:hypothetical protein
MNPLVLRLLLSLAVELLRILIRHYNSLTPEQRTELQNAIRDLPDPMGGSMDGP